MAVPLQARAVPTYWKFVVGLACDGTAVPLQAWAVPSFWRLRLKKNFSPFSRIGLGQLPTK